MLQIWEIEKGNLLSLTNGEGTSNNNTVRWKRTQRLQNLETFQPHGSLEDSSPFVKDKSLPFSIYLLKPIIFLYI